MRERDVRGEEGEERERRDQQPQQGVSRDRAIPLVSRGAAPPLWGYEPV